MNLKKVFIILVAFVFVMPLFAQGMKFRAQVNGGLTLISNDDFNQMINGMVNLSSDIYSGLGYDSYNISGDEISGFFAPDIELSLQMNSIMAGLKIGVPGTVTSVFKIEASDSTFGDTYQEMELRNWAFPIGLNLYYVLNLADGMNLFIDPGFEFVSSEITQEEVKHTEDGVDQTLDDPEVFKGSGIMGILNVKGEYSFNDMFSVFLGLTGRFGKITGYEGQGDLSGEKLYSFDGTLGGNTYHLWESLTPEEKSSYEDDSTVSNLKEAEINMNGVAFYLGIALNFGL